MHAVLCCAVLYAYLLAGVLLNHINQRLYAKLEHEVTRYNYEPVYAEVKVQLVRSSRLDLRCSVVDDTLVGRCQ